MELPKRPLGTSGFEITTVGFGAWTARGGAWAFGWGPQDDGDSVKAIVHAVSRGVNWIDTASVYGLGHSEVVVGRALRELTPAERPLVFTKCGMQWDDQDPMAKPRRISDPAEVPGECEASLKRLGVEVIDLMQFHWPDESGRAVEDSWAALAKLQQQGKVRAVGLCNYDVSRLERAEKVHHVDSLQPPFSLIKRAVGAAEIPWCRARHRRDRLSPMQSGCSPTVSRPSGCALDALTGAATRPSTSRRGSRPTSPCATPSRPSPASTGCPWGRWPSRGPWPGRE
jgi:aryl-alcohol dehydrogenase-like predicted oxidoreductase